MKYLLTVALPGAFPILFGRHLAPAREFLRLRDADAWACRNADSFRDSLLPNETYFTAWILDEDQEVMRTLEFPSGLGAEPTVLGRKTLRRLRAGR